MIIDCISDLHGEQPMLPGGDLLIVAGDLTAGDSECEHALFDYWLNDQPYSKKVVIAGNHDNVLAEGRLKFQFCDYLCDSGTEFEGLKIWGSPWTHKFSGVNPHCTAFMISEEELAKKWTLIPDNTDILVTHSPPNGIMDRTTGSRMHVGSPSLKEHVMDRIKPKLHVFGHIHEWGGFKIKEGMTEFVNASVMNEDYDLVRDFTRVII